MLITVAICTWNRASLLQRTLEQLTRMKPLPGDTSWELIVVDNACTDSTADVIESFGSLLPIRRVCEPQPGLSNARNAAIAEAAGDVIVWTDDDVLVDPAWLCEYAIAFQKHPTAEFFGGPISAWFDAPPPAWLATVFPQVVSAFAVRELESEDIPITRTFAPYGANMAFRRRVLNNHSFDPRLGRLGDSAIGGEETAVFRDLMERGYQGRWVRGASVRHFVSEDRQTTEYIRSYYSGVAATASRAAAGPSAVSTLFGRPRWAWRASLQYEMMYQLRRLVAPPQIWIEDLKRASLARGALVIAGQPG